MILNLDSRLPTGRRWLGRVCPAVIGLALTAAACGQEAAPTSRAAGCSGVRVVATTTVLGDAMSNIVGEQGSVEVLMPTGADPHAFQASARQAASMRSADLVVAVGLGLEEGLADLLAGARSDGVDVVEAGSFVDAQPFTGEARIGSGEGSVDPHFWNDPRLMAEAVVGIGESLAGTDAGCAQGWRGAAAAYAAKVLEADAEVEALLSGIPAERRLMVTNHHAFDYFARRYGFELMGVVIPGGSTLAAPSPADVAALVTEMRGRSVFAVFVETTEPTAVAQTVAAEAGAAVVTLYAGSLGEPGSGADTYLGMLLTNARRIAEALAG
jgi:zinc/manganese transport system substrate-binding protein